MNDHHDFYRDNFINDQVGFESDVSQNLPRFIGGGQGTAKDGTNN